MAAGSRVLETLAEQLTAAFQPDGLVIYGDVGEPDIVAVDRELGLIAVDVNVEEGPASDSPIIQLNRKISALEEGIPEVGDADPHALILHSLHQSPLIRDTCDGPMPRLGWPDVMNGGWPMLLKPRPLAAGEFEAIRAGLAPAMCFTARARRGVADPGREERRKRQIMLDAEQRRIAQAPMEDVLLLSGPPGSGKSLVLAARARFLAMKHPAWRIVLLCYNNALLPYLRHLTGGYPNIVVNTFGKFSHGEGHRFSLRDDEEEAECLSRARRKGIRRTVDALLIDEAQDFRDAWISFALDTLRPGHGGALLAGDARQALYEHSPASHVFAGRRVDTLRLKQPYRSTRQILEVASASQPGREPLDWAGALEGEPVQLIYADSWDEQARAAAWEIRKLIDDEGRRPEEMAVLVTKKFGTFTRLTTALTAQDVPHIVIDRRNAASFDPESPQVKIMTVNAAKGYEFDVVVLFGLDALVDPPAPHEGPDPRHGRWGNAALVGMTRARDLLLITWTTHTNPHIERLSHLVTTRNDAIRSHAWPEDYR